VALLPRFLIEGELERGDLCLALNLPWQSEDAYYLAWPASRADYGPLRAFREWLRAQTQPESGSA